jgi:transposase
MPTIKTRRRPALGAHPPAYSQALPVIQPDAAGIDLGATCLTAAVPPDRDTRPIRTFGTFTEDLQELVRWLRQCRIRTVALEATGVFWVPVFQVLEAAGFEVCLVNPRHLKNVRGRKTDVCDAQWLQQLHAVGLLHASFRPPDAICALRTLHRQREHLVRQAAEQIQMMQKALTQMNLHLHHVLSDLSGTSGLRIIDALLEGERDPAVLARLRDPRVQTDEETIIAALTGDWRPEHLFTLRQARQTYTHYQDLLRACDAEIERWLNQHPLPPEHSQVPLSAETAKRPSRNTPRLPQLDLRQEMANRFGVDLIPCPALGIATVTALYAELGADLSAFKSGKHFSSWLALCPDPRKSGGKVLKSHTRNVQHRVAQIFRQAAVSVRRSDNHLGRFYRRMQGKLGKPEAVTATAHKLARIFYHLVTTGEAYDETVFQREDERYEIRRRQALKRQATAMGFNLVPIDVS